MVLRTLSRYRMELIGSTTLVEIFSAGKMLKAALVMHNYWTFLSLSSSKILAVRPEPVPPLMELKINRPWAI